MADIVTPEKRSRMMSGIRGQDTGPELAVRRHLHANGFRFRLHVRNLPGRPDVVLPRFRTVVFVHGCFWHRHKDCRYAYTPKSNQRFWLSKLQSNADRDVRDQLCLAALGWRVEVVWECQIGGPRLAELTANLARSP